MHRHSTLEQIERDVWPPYDYPTGLVRRCHELRKVPLNRLTPEDLRLLIGQEIGLQYLVPLALEFLQVDPLLECDFYPGDLLNNVLAVKDPYWQQFPSQKLALDRLAAPVLGQLRKR